MKQITKNQHRVPKMLLKRFGVEKLWYFDFKDKTIVQKSTTKATVEKYYYESEELEVNEIENILAKWEGKASPIIDELEKGDTTLTLEQMEVLFKFTFMMMLRTGSTEALKNNAPRDEAELFGSLFFGQDKDGILESIKLVDETNMLKELAQFRKWWSKMNLKINKGQESYDGTIIDQYRLWPKKNKFPPIFLRQLVDWNQHKMIIIETCDFFNIMSDNWSAGRRLMGNLIYYAFPISHSKTLILTNDEWLKANSKLFKNEHIFKTFTKKSKRISTIEPYYVKTFKLEPLESFEMIWTRMNETKLFLMFPFLNMGVDYCKKFIQYSIANGFDSKLDVKWIIPFLEANDEITEKYREEAKQLSWLNREKFWHY